MGSQEREEPPPASEGGTDAGRGWLRPGRLIWPALLVIAALGAFLLGRGGAEQDAAKAKHGLLPAGRQAPGFDLRTPAGVRHTLAAARGKVALVEFFATWCEQCKAEAPVLNRLQRGSAPGGVVFLGVNGDSEDAASVTAYRRRQRVEFPLLLDPGGQAGSTADPGTPGRVSARYGAAAYPTIYVIDARGRVAFRGSGRQSEAALRRALKAAAAGRTAGSGSAGGGCTRTETTAGPSGCTPAQP